MSGENRRPGGWILPVLVIGVGAYFLVTKLQGGSLQPANLKPVNWIGLPLMVVGAVAAFGKKPWIRLAGLTVAVVGAMLVFI